MAITAVVLGGASIFGGRGTVLGTVLGLFAIVVLQNGLRLSRQPAELAGILTGVLLLVTIVLNRFSGLPSEGRQNETEEIDVKNSQVAVLSAVILLAALLVAGSNWVLVRSLRQDPSSGQPFIARPYACPSYSGSDDAESEGRSLFCELSTRCRGSRKGAWC
jgi:rhamnose transport system permease protein